MKITYKNYFVMENTEETYKKIIDENEMEEQKKSHKRPYDEWKSNRDSYDSNKLKAFPLYRVKDPTLNNPSGSLFGFQVDKENPNKINELNELKDIILYDTERSPYQVPIYIKLANADSLDKAMLFTETYGSIVNPRLIPHSSDTNRTYSSISNLAEVNIISDQHKDSSPITLYDCTIYEHFRFYQSNLRCLIEIHRLLQDNPQQHVSALAGICYEILRNYFFEPMFSLEYEEMYDYEQDKHLFSFNPFFEYIHHCYSSNHPENIVFPEMKFNDLVHNFLKKGKELDNSIDQSNEKPISELFSESYAYATVNATNIIELSKYLFSNVLSFFLRDIRPAVSYTSPELDFNWSFHSLADAIFFHFYIDHSAAKHFAICENEKCRNIFYASSSTPRKKYCCQNCGVRVAKRKEYKKNHP